MNSLTGRWLGRYEYRRGAPPVGFEVDLVEESGALSGECREANTFRPDVGGELFSMFVGSVTGAEVDFVKRYLGFEVDDHPAYAGTVNPGLTRIEGTWHFPQFPGENGRFTMARKPAASAQARKVVAQELEFTRP